MSFCLSQLNDLSICLKFILCHQNWITTIILLPNKIVFNREVTLQKVFIYQISYFGYCWLFGSYLFLYDKLILLLATQINLFKRFSTLIPWYWKLQHKGEIQMNREKMQIQTQDLVAMRYHCLLHLQNAERSGAALAEQVKCFSILAFCSSLKKCEEMQAEF